jgi:transcriptional regulator with XRE-family HTH domain
MIGLEVLLKFKNMQQTELAERVGVSKQIVNIWLNKVRLIPKKYYDKLSEIFGCSNEIFSQDVDEKLFYNIAFSILTKDYKFLLSQAFNTDISNIDDNILSLIKLEIEKNEINKRKEQIEDEISKIKSS